MSEITLEDIRRIVREELNFTLGNGTANTAQKGLDTHDEVQPGYLNSAQAAEYLGMAVETLKRYRLEGRGPKWYRVGRPYLYRVEDLDGWVQSGTTQGA